MSDNSYRYAVYRKRSSELLSRWDVIDVLYTEEGAHKFIQRHKMGLTSYPSGNDKDEYTVSKVSVEEARELLSWIEWREKH